MKNKFRDSKFTFYRGNLRSQNDLLLSNVPGRVVTFKTLGKTVYSDHCPPSGRLTLCSLLKDCSVGVFNDDYWDIHKRELAPLNCSEVDWIKATTMLEEDSPNLSRLIRDNDLTIYTTQKIT